MAQRKSKIRKEKTGKQVCRRSKGNILRANYLARSGFIRQIIAQILTVINTLFMQFYANGCISHFTEQVSISIGCNNSPA
jgi:hypothetical protein